MLTAKVDDTITVAHQIQPDDVAALREAGFVAIVNNRPDGEAFDQPAGADIEKAAEAAGLAYVALPIGRDGIAPTMLKDLRAFLADADGPVLAFCRTGTRSINLWALAQAVDQDPDTLIDLAAQAGYDLSGLRPVLASLAESG